MLKVFYLLVNGKGIYFDILDCDNEEVNQDTAKGGGGLGAIHEKVNTSVSTHKLQYCPISLVSVETLCCLR